MAELLFQKLMVAHNLHSSKNVQQIVTKEWCKAAIPKKFIDKVTPICINSGGDLNNQLVWYLNGL